MSAIHFLFIITLTHAQFRPIVQRRALKRVVITSTQVITPPLGAKRALVRAWGAGGGSGANSSNGIAGGRGGGGGFVSAEFNVTSIAGQAWACAIIGAAGQGGVNMLGFGSGGSGGLSTRLVASTSGGCTDTTNPALIAAGGGGGGGAGPGPGNNGVNASGADGGGGGFSRGADAAAACANTNSPTGCPGGGGGGSGGLNQGGTGGSVGTANQSCPYSSYPSSGGSGQTNATTGDGGGTAGTCFQNPYGYGSLNGSQGSASVVYWSYDHGNNDGAQHTCTGGGGGGGLVGGGGGGIQGTDTPTGCGGGGGGAGYLGTSSIGNLTWTSTRVTADASGPTPGNASDPDVRVGGQSRATGGVTSAGAGQVGVNGTPGLMVIHFY